MSNTRKYSYCNRIIKVINFRKSKWTIIDSMSKEAMMRTLVGRPTQKRVVLYKIVQEKNT